MHKDFSDDAWEDYTYWVIHDKKVLKKINQLFADIERNGNDGIGHPEPLTSIDTIAKLFILTAHKNYVSSNI